MSTTSHRDESRHEPVTAAQRRAEALRRAARNKRQAASARAEAAIRDLVKDQQEINFRSVARAAGVSLDFLYANAELRRRIESLRAQQTTTSVASSKAVPENPDSNIAHILTAKLRDERAARRTAVKELEERLAAAHGELLQLRRLLQHHDIQP